MPVPPKPLRINSIPTWILDEFPLVRKLTKEKFEYLKDTEIVENFLRLRRLYYSNRLKIQDYSDLFFIGAMILAGFINHYYARKRNGEKRLLEFEDIYFIVRFSLFKEPKTRFELQSLRGDEYFTYRETGLFKPIEYHYYHAANVIDGSTSNLIEIYLENPANKTPEQLSSLLNFIKEFGLYSKMTIELRKKIISILISRFDLKLADSAVEILFQEGAREFSYIQELYRIQKELIENGILRESPETKNAYRDYIFHIARKWEALCNEILQWKFGEIASLKDKNTTLITNKIPDFILESKSIVRDSKGKVKWGNIFVDAKKSILAIYDDVELYTPYCGELWFAILDDDVRFKIPDKKVKCIYAKEMIQEWGLPKNLSLRIDDLYSLSMNRKDGFEKYLVDSYKSERN